MKLLVHGSASGFKLGDSHTFYDILEDYRLQHDELKLVCSENPGLLHRLQSYTAAFPKIPLDTFNEQGLGQFISKETLGRVLKKHSDATVLIFGDTKSGNLLATVAVSLGMTVIRSGL